MASLMFIISVSILLTLGIVLVLVQLTRISKNKPVEYEYEGELEGFPENVVNAMLDEQERQGNPRDVTVFERNKLASTSIGGFEWSNTPYGAEYWTAIITKRRFYLLD